MSVNIKMKFFLVSEQKKLAYMCMATAYHVFGCGTSVSVDES